MCCAYGWPRRVSVFRIGRRAHGQGARLHLLCVRRWPLCTASACHSLATSCVALVTAYTRAGATGHAFVLSRVRGAPWRGRALAACRCARRSPYFGACWRPCLRHTPFPAREHGIPDTLSRALSPVPPPISPAAPAPALAAPGACTLRVAPCRGVLRRVVRPLQHPIPRTRRASSVCRVFAAVARRTRAHVCASDGAAACAPAARAGGLPRAACMVPAT